ncbi:recombinase family protein [Natronincola ferrireducens]|uniref:Site-specific DNA recombinase n=1 Tax=Natronincola ferrireducens TaxID=393762 RepID=A0A1G8ZGB7_9FIRM|nr:recombinase family protein [Natronincola ferrireducens]SDK13190.1 site-specific DNA recombinase [Natronincola ferrireducens]
MIAIKTIAIYSRKSKFTDKGESVQNQVALCKEYGQLHFEGKSFIIYDDEGFSGGNIDRPQFKKMMEDAKEKKFDVLICYRLDRISRNITDFTKLVELLQSHDVAFVSIKEQFDTSTPMGRAMMYIALVFAQLERETIAERIRDNMIQLARTGRWLGGVTPTGFKSEAITYYDHHMNKKRMYQLTPIQKELEIVKIIYEKYLQLNSLSQLESWCLKKHLRTKNNKCFDKSSLKLILMNPVYAVADESLHQYFQSLGMDVASPKEAFNGRYGVLVYNKHQEKSKTCRLKKYTDWIVAISKHQGIISSMDWIQVQSQLKKNSKKAPREGNSRVALLTPLLLCNSCGSKLKVTYKTKNGEILHHYYKCTLKERSRSSLCTMINLNGKQAEEIVLKELKKFTTSSSKFIDVLLTRRNTLLSLKEFENNNPLNLSLKKKLDTYENTISILTLKLAENQGSTAEKYILQEIEKIDKKIRDTREQLGTLINIDEFITIVPPELQITEGMFKNFFTLLHEADFYEKKKILQILIKDIVWDGEKLEINIY